jgi:hypothetical protein
MQGGDSRLVRDFPKQGGHGGGAGFDRRFHLRPGLPEAGSPDRCLQTPDQPGLAGQRGALRPDDGERQEGAVVSGEAGQEPGAEERGLAGARGAKDHQEARRRGFGQAAEAVKRLDGRSLAAEEDAGVLGFERTHAAIGWPVGIVLRRPLEETRVEAGTGEAGLEALEARDREGDVRFAAVGEDGTEDAVVGALREVDELPVGGQLGGQVADRDRLDEDAEAPLVELLGEAELAEAPVGVDPGAADQKENRLAAVGGLMQPPLPALAGGDAA